MAFLLDSILLAPVNGIVFVANKVRDMAMDQLLDEEGTRRELRGLYSQLERGEISEDEFETREAQLVERLEEIEAHKDGKRE